MLFNESSKVRIHVLRSSCVDSCLWAQALVKTWQKYWNDPKPSQDLSRNLPKTYPAKACQNLSKAYQTRNNTYQQFLKSHQTLIRNLSKSFQMFPSKSSRPKEDSTWNPQRTRLWTDKMIAPNASIRIAMCAFAAGMHTYHIRKHLEMLCSGGTASKVAGKGKTCDSKANSVNSFFDMCSIPLRLQLMGVRATH